MRPKQIRVHEDGQMKTRLGNVQEGPEELVTGRDCEEEKGIRDDARSDGRVSRQNIS